MVLIAAGEDGPRSFDAPDLPELRLAGLDAESAGRLLVERSGSPVEAGVLARLTAETEGNPLALIELPRVLSAEQLAGREPLPEPLPIGADLERSFLERVALLAPDSRAALLFVAAAGGGDATAVSRAARSAGVDLRMLAPAEAAGFVRMGANGARVPSSARALGDLRRSWPGRAAGGAWALAEALDDEAHADRRAWHLAAATVGPTVTSPTSSNGQPSAPGVAAVTERRWRRWSAPRI